MKFLHNHSWNSMGLIKTKVPYVRKEDKKWVEVPNSQNNKFSTKSHAI
jgi:hypothetical protein